MAKAITQEVIVEINELYLKIGTYAGVSRAMGGSPSAGTVKKYIIPNYVAQKEIKIIPFDRSKLPSKDVEANVKNFINKFDEKFLYILTPEEREDMKELWKEIQL